MHGNELRRRGFGCLCEMGCGKTLTAIAVAGTAYQLGKIRKVLIVAPTSVCSVWPKEFDEYADFRYNVQVLLGDKQKRLAALRSLDAFPFQALLVAVINYESVWRDGLIEAFEAWAPDMIIADESQRIKDSQSHQSKGMHRLGDVAKYKLILSGTPIQNNAADLYSQYRFLDPSVFGKSFYAFRARYCIMGGFDRRQIIGYKNMDELIKKEHSIAYRVTKDEALDLPEQTFLSRYIRMEPKHKNIYDKIKRDGFAELESGGQITAPIFVFDGKINALGDILEDYVISAGKKLVVFCRFRPEIDLIEKMLQKKRIKYAAIYGDIEIKARGPIVADFQQNPETMVFLAQIDTAGLGITLTAADTCVYYSVNFNYAAYSQSLSRIHRIGQKHPCTYIHLVVEGTIDETVLKALAKKEDLAKTVVDSWREFF